VTFGQAGAILATLALSVHKTPPPRDGECRELKRLVIRMKDGPGLARLERRAAALISRHAPPKSRQKVGQESPDESQASFSA